MDPVTSDDPGSEGGNPYRPPRSTELEAGGAEAAARRTQLERLRQFATLTACGAVLGCSNLITSLVEVHLLRISTTDPRHVLFRVSAGLLWLTGMAALATAAGAFARATQGPRSALGYAAAVLSVSPVIGGLLLLATDIPVAVRVTVHFLPQVVWLGMLALMEWPLGHLSLRRRLVRVAAWAFLTLVLLSKGIDTIIGVVHHDLVWGYFIAVSGQVGPPRWDLALLASLHLAFFGTAVAYAVDLRRQINLLLRPGH